METEQINFLSVTNLFDKLTNTFPHSGVVIDKMRKVYHQRSLETITQCYTRTDDVCSLFRETRDMCCYNFVSSH